MARNTFRHVAFADVDDLASQQQQVDADEPTSGWTAFGSRRLRLGAMPPGNAEGGGSFDSPRAAL
jgi:hypothetical protein